MAYFQKKNEEENNNNQNTNQSGGSYQTSSSEVGTNTNLNDNSNRQNNISNQSGNWVNLNDYIQANEGKSGRYASNLVSDDLNKGTQYQSDLGTTKDTYGKALRQDTAYNYGSDQSNKVAKNYYNDSSSVNDDELSTFAKASKGYQGVDQWSNTGDLYGYDTMKNTSDYFSELTGGILDPTYRANNKMNANLNQGSKILNNLTLNSDTAQNTLKDASNQFSILSGLLAGVEEEANKDRAGVVEKANANANALKNAITTNKALAQKQLDDSKQKAEQSRQAKQNQASQVKTYKAPLVNLWGKNIDIGSFTGKDTSKFFKDPSSIESDYTKEKNELNQREADLLSGNRSGNSTLDLVKDNSSYDSINATFQQWNEEGRAGNLPSIINEAYKITQNLNEDRGVMTEDYVRSKIEDVILNNKTVRDAMQSYVWGNINKETLRDIIVNSIPRYKTAGVEDWVARAWSGVTDFFGF